MPSDLDCELLSEQFGDVGAANLVYSAELMGQLFEFRVDFLSVPLYLPWKVGFEPIMPFLGSFSPYFILIVPNFLCY